MNYKSILKRQTFIIVISVICLTLGVIGGSFALFFSISDDDNNQVVKAGELSINFGKNGSTIEGELLPMSDEDGMAQVGANFAITNEGSLPGLYYIAVYNNTVGETDLSAFLNHEYLRISIDNNDPQTLSEVKHTEDTLDKTNQNEIHYELLKGTIESDTTNNANIETHNIKLWIKEDAPTDIIGKLIRLQIEVVSVVGKAEYADNSGAEKPVLNNGLIPVIYKDNKWIKADISTKWYDYDEQWWANAVTVSSSTRSTYTSAAANTPINMNDIETMWVWIPRYEYRSTNLGDQYAEGRQELPGEIEIHFVSRKTWIPSKIPDLTIHDAFWWDDNNNGVTDANEYLSGIWVAKFEMNAASPTSNTLQNPIIKPNVTSWRNAQIGTFWTAIHNNMNGENNLYGLINSDAHLMKNMEWGAVAYLSQSKYGKYGNSAYQGTDKEVAINNCDSYITGIGGDTVSATSSSETCTTNTYETEKGQAASTTGNIYGIYDMSGGASEYVMGVMKENTNTEPIVGLDATYNSGWSGKLYDETDFTGIYGPLYGETGIGSKYYDLYDYQTDNGSARYHDGDATHETSSWYSDIVLFVNSDGSFFNRGSYHGSTTSAGVFSMTNSTGSVGSSYSGRPVLVQTN